MGTLAFEQKKIIQVSEAGAVVHFNGRPALELSQESDGCLVLLAMLCIEQVACVLVASGGVHEEARVDEILQLAGEVLVQVVQTILVACCAGFDACLECGDKLAVPDDMAAEFFYLCVWEGDRFHQAQKRRLAGIERC
jgi:hypothetical protein